MPLGLHQFQSQDIVGNQIERLEDETKTLLIKNEMFSLPSPRAIMEENQLKPEITAITEEIITEPYWRWLSVNYENWFEAREMRWFKEKRHLVEVIFAVLILLFAMSVRMYDLRNPGAVVFDEVHFGKFAGRHINGTFFVDVHPPLAKLLVTLSGWMAGYDGKFAFDQIGMDYDGAGVPYVAMRGLGAFLGSCTVSLAFLTLREADVSMTWSIIGSMAVLFENALACQSRLILLDSYLIFFTALTAYAWTRFHKTALEPFTRNWTRNLLFLGFSLGLTLSCKWVGLFSVGTVGVFTIAYLWRLWINPEGCNLDDFGLHFVTRAWGLLMVPFFTYMAIFGVEFWMLNKHSVDSNGMSVGFQMALKGYPGNFDTFKRVSYGSEIRIKSSRYNELFLHSHAHSYPASSNKLIGKDGKETMDSSGQQQITGYTFRDKNNEWIIRGYYTDNFTEASDIDIPDERHTINWLKQNNLVRLEHKSTGKYLKSHQIQAPISVESYEVCASAFSPSDTNNVWRIHVVYSPDSTFEYPLPEPGKGRDINARETFIRLEHVETGCYLATFGKKLPKWGFQHKELVCAKNAKFKNSVWEIDSNYHGKFDSTMAKASYSTSWFFTRFIELNVVMWNSNAGLVASHPFESRPQDWPFMRRGMGFWNGNDGTSLTLDKYGKFVDEDDDEESRKDSSNFPDWEEKFEQQDELGKVTLKEDKRERQKRIQQSMPAKLVHKREYFPADPRWRNEQIYLLGNPIVWWTVTIVIFSRFALETLKIFLKKRKIEPFDFDSEFSITSVSGFMAIGWLLHILPFFLMKRQLFLHHYLPGLYLGILHVFLLTKTLRGNREMRKNLSVNFALGVAFQILVLASIIIAFHHFAPLSYALPVDRERCESMKWLQSWDFNCNNIYP